MTTKKKVVKQVSNVTVTEELGTPSLLLVRRHPFFLMELWTSNIFDCIYSNSLRTIYNTPVPLVGNFLWSNTMPPRDPIYSLQSSSPSNSLDVPAQTQINGAIRDFSVEMDSIAATVAADSGDSSTPSAAASPLSADPSTAASSSAFQAAATLSSQSDSTATPTPHDTNLMTLGRPKVSYLCQQLSRSDTDPHLLIEPHRYGVEGDAGEGRNQPFRVVVHPQVGLLADFHSHMCDAEVIGLLAGRWDVEAKCLFVQAPFPCTSTERADDDGSTDVELDPSAELQAREAISTLGMHVVGWYHSHPRFRPDPSITDIFNQAQYQRLMRDEQTGLEPFVGLIVSSYDQGLESTSAVHQWFHVIPFVVETSRAKKEVFVPMLISTTIASLSSEGICLAARVEDSLMRDIQEGMMTIIKDSSLGSDSSRRASRGGEGNSGDIGNMCLLKRCNHPPGRCNQSSAKPKATSKTNSRSSSSSGSSSSSSSSSNVTGKSTRRNVLDASPVPDADPPLAKRRANAKAASRLPSEQVASEPASGGEGVDLLNKAGEAPSDISPASIRGTEIASYNKMDGSVEVVTADDCELMSVVDHVELRQIPDRVLNEAASSDEAVPAYLMSTEESEVQLFGFSARGGPKHLDCSLPVESAAAVEHVLVSVDLMTDITVQTGMEGSDYDYSATFLSEQSNNDVQDEQQSDVQQADEEEVDEQQADVYVADEEEADEQQAGEEVVDEQEAGEQQADIQVVDVQQAGEEVVDEQHADVQVVDEQQADEQQADIQVVDVQQADVQVVDEQQADVQVVDVQQSDVQVVDVQQSDVQVVDVQVVDVQEADEQEADEQEADVPECCNEQEFAVQEVDVECDVECGVQEAGVECDVECGLQEANEQECDVQDVDEQEAGVECDVECDVEQAIEQKCDVEQVDEQANEQQADVECDVEEVDEQECDVEDCDVQEADEQQGADVQEAGEQECDEQQADEQQAGVQELASLSNDDYLIATHVSIDLDQPSSASSDVSVVRNAAPALVVMELVLQQSDDASWVEPREADDSLIFEDLAGRSETSTDNGLGQESFSSTSTLASMVPGTIMRKTSRKRSSDRIMKLDIASIHNHVAPMADSMHVDQRTTSICDLTLNNDTVSDMSCKGTSAAIIIDVDPEPEVLVREQEQAFVAQDLGNADSLNLGSSVEVGTVVVERVGPVLRPKRTRLQVKLEALAPVCAAVPLSESAPAVVESHEVDQIEAKEMTAPDVLPPAEGNSRPKRKAATSTATATATAAISATATATVITIVKTNEQDTIVSKRSHSKKPKTMPSSEKPEPDIRSSSQTCSPAVSANPRASRSATVAKSTVAPAAVAPTRQKKEVAIAVSEEADVPGRISARQASRLELQKVAAEMAAILGETETVQAPVKRTAPKKKKKTKQSLSFDDSAAPCSLLQLLQSDSGSCRLARDLICCASERMRFPLMLISALVFYYSSHARRVDLNKPWKTINRLEKATLSVIPWLQLMSLSEGEARALAAQLKDFLSMSWQESPKESRRRSATMTVFDNIDARQSYVKPVASILTCGQCV